MFALKLPNPKAAVRQAEPVRSRARYVRDDIEMPLATDPALDPALDAVDQGDVLEEPTVQAVTAVDPQVKKYRATITRTVTQTAIVEYEALETQASYSVAEDLAAQVPAESWTTDPSNSWCYIDKLEDLGPAGTAEPAIETADDDTLQTDPDDPDAENPDDEAPQQAGRSRRRARHVRSTADELIAQGQSILDTANTARNSLGGSGVEPWDVVATLEQCQQQITDLQNSVDTNGMGDDADAQASAAQFLADAAYEIAEMLNEARADAEAAVSDAIHEYLA